MSSVTTMGFLFNNVIVFNQNISGWDVSSVTDFSSIFFGSDSFNYRLCWNVTEDKATTIRTSRTSDDVSVGILGDCTASISDSPSSSPSSSPSISPSNSPSSYLPSSPSSSPPKFHLRSPSSSPSSLPALPCTPGRDCLRCLAHCYARRDTVVNTFNSFNFKEKNRGYFTLYSFREFAVDALFVSDTNKHNKQVSWMTQVNTTGPNGQPQLFDITNCRSNRRNQTVVKYTSVRGEIMKVFVICKRKGSIKTSKNFRLDVKVRKVDSHIRKCNRGINCFLEYESGGTGLCFPSSTRRTKRGPKCKKS